MAQPFDITKATGNSALSRIGDLPDLSSPQTAKDLSSRLQAHSNRVNYFKRMAEESMRNGNQNSAQAYINQAMTEYEKASAVQDQLAYVQRVSAQRGRADRNALAREQARVRRHNPVLSSIMESKPAQIGAMVGGEVLRMLGDTARGGEKALEYLGKSLQFTPENANQAFYNRDFVVGGDPASVMSPSQTINLKDVAKEIGVAGAKNAGTYVDAMNSIRNWFMNNRWGSKPDSEDEKYRKMFGKGAREALGGRELQDPTIARGADVIADPLALIPIAGRAKAGVDAVTDPKLWEGIARDMGQASQSKMFIPITPMRMGSNPKGATVGLENFEDAYQPVVRDAYKQYKEMKARGASPQEIFKQTRVFENVDGIPYFETDDQLLRIDIPAIRESWRAGRNPNMDDVISHPELDSLDYILQGNPVENTQKIAILPQYEKGGALNFNEGKLSVDVNAPDDEFRKTVAHELNHLVSPNRGVMLSGSNLDMAPYWLSQNYSKIASESKKYKDALLKAREKATALYQDAVSTKDALRKMYESGINYSNQAEAKALYELAKKKEKQYASAYKKYSDMQSRTGKPIITNYPTNFELYEGNMGEALSRLTESRLDLPKDFRQGLYPLNATYFQSKTGYTPDQLWYARYKYLDELNRGNITDINDPLIGVHQYNTEYPDKIKSDVVNYLTTGKIALDFAKQRK